MRDFAELITEIAGPLGLEPSPQAALDEVHAWLSGHL
jgi:hypothetical protein